MSSYKFVYGGDMEVGDVILGQGEPRRVTVLAIDDHETSGQRFLVAVDPEGEGKPTARHIRALGRYCVERAPEVKP